MENILVNQNLKNVQTEKVDEEEGGVTLKAQGTETQHAIFTPLTLHSKHHDQQ